MAFLDGRVKANGTPEHSADGNALAPQRMQRLPSEECRESSAPSPDAGGPLCIDS
jgi:hypothetical protein